MIVLFTHFQDGSTNKIIEWLHHFQCPFKRVHLEEEHFQNIKIELKSGQPHISLLLNSGEIIDFNEVSFFVYRGGRFGFNPSNLTTGNLPAAIARNYLQLDYETLIDFFYEQIQQKGMGYVSRTPVNKLKQLQLAKKHGICVPDTLVTSDAKYARENFDFAVNKAIQENVFAPYGEDVFSQKVDTIKTETIPEHFFPSLFQAPIEKAYEVRSFFLNGKFYSLQLITPGKDLSIDYRDNYGTIRYGAIDLPKQLEEKLNNLMNDLNLISGSIDLIVDKKGQHYFLEVNPEGQYDWVSTYGNYHLDREIAAFLNEQNRIYHEGK